MTALSPPNVMWRALAVAVLILYAGILYQKLPGDWSALQASAFLDHQQYSRALAAYEQAALHHPDDPSLQVHIARLYQVRGNSDVALAHLEQALRLQPRYLPALTLQAEIRQQRDPAAALALWQDVLQIAPGNRDGRLGEAATLVRLSQLDKAEGVLSALVAERPKDAAALLALAQLKALSQPEEALRLLQTAQNEDDKLAPTVRQWQEAISEIQRESNPAAAAAQFGTAALRLGQPALAGAAFAKAVQERPDYLDARAYEALALQQNGDAAGAEALLRQILRSAPGHALSHYFLGLTLRAQSRLPEAIEEFRQTVDLTGEDADILIDLGQTYAMNGDFAEAEAQFQRAIEIRPADQRTTLALAHFYLDHGFRVERGLEAASLALAVAPGSAEARDLLGWALHLNGRSDEAKAALQAVLKQDPSYAAAHYHLGVIFETGGDATRAKAAYEQAVDLDFGGPIMERATRALNALAR